MDKIKEPRNRKEWRTRCKWYVPCADRCAYTTHKTDLTANDWRCKGQCQRMRLYDRVTYGKEVEFEIE